MKKTIRTVPEHDVCSNMSSRHEVSYLNTTGIRNIYSRLSLSISAPMLNFDPNVRMSGTRYRYPWDELLPVLCTRTSTISSKLRLYIAHSFVVSNISPLTNTLALRESRRQEFSSLGVGITARKKTGFQSSAKTNKRNI